MKKLSIVAVLLLLYATVAMAGTYRTPLYCGEEWLLGVGTASNTLDILNHANNDDTNPSRIYTFGSSGGTTTYTLYYRDHGNDVAQTITMTMVDGMSFSSTLEGMPQVDSVTVARANVNIHAYFHAWVER